MSVLADEYRLYTEKGGVVCLADRAHLIFRGADRVRFLNGQVTANVATAKPGSVIPTCVTTAKGKLCADAFVTVRTDDIFVDVDFALAESLSARFERYIVADDVTIQNVSERLERYHLLGITPESLPGHLHSLLMPANRFGIPGHDLMSKEPALSLGKLWEELRAIFPFPSDGLQDLIRLERGVPRWGFELDENTLPAEAGLDRTHVDFKKGCYIGQEVISRVKSVGHVNRELSGFTAEMPITRGARLFTADAPDKDLGTITSSAFSFALDRHIALGYLRRGAPTTGLLAASEEAAPVRVDIHPLPFVS